MYDENYQESTPIVSKTNVGFSLVFVWMFFGILVTAGFAFLCTLFPQALLVSYSMPGMIISGIVQIVIALSLGKAALVKLNKGLAATLFFVYSAINGITFGLLFYVLNASELFAIFGITAGFFGIMALCSVIFKEQLRRSSGFFMIGLVALLIMSIVSSILWYNNTLLLGVAIVGLLVFGGLTAFDMRWIKDAMDRSDNPSGVAIYGAFHLYLDFINIFMYIVRIFLLSNRD